MQFRPFLLLVLQSLLFLLCGCFHRPMAELCIHAPMHPPEFTPLTQPKVALVLGGGGSKGLAHVGVLEVLEGAKIPIDLIVGTSSGAIIGALYADSQSAQKVKSLLINRKKEDFLDFSIYSTLQMGVALKAPFSGYALEKFLIDNLQHKSMEDLGIPFIAVTTDITQNKAFNIQTGPIAPAVHASAAIPPFFSPVALYNRILSDGGLIYPVPVTVAKEHNPKLTIAIDIAAPPTPGCPGNMFSLLYQGLYISYYELSRMQSKQADINIHPNLTGFGILEDHRNEAIYLLGKKAAEEALPGLLEKLEAAGIPLKN